ncbi:hypothetical protein LV84_01359 [Algoriphagus ratkowskyi]|uniref:Uncharacterized protein n=1 Tax=Algoriphagus ratkowskyi TaxID=57028 RepID=A0A2W7REE8_9BACT|nr:hypothetical protein [Algoriphagus ratkowskyi]PZX59328.1 hypothetical protein LV84_01359 [Algoriphagus ratkowskyi]TXD77405.1 hypothetical protein ESW18_11395 [Algoriphagus ratkowskyi]
MSSGDLPISVINPEPNSFPLKVWHEEALVVAKIKTLFKWLSAFLPCSSYLKFFKRNPFGTGAVAKCLLILAFFLLCSTGNALSQSLDSLSKIKFNNKVAIDSREILDSLDLVRKGTEDSLMLLSRKIKGVEHEIIQNRASKNIVGNKSEILKVPALELPDFKLPELDHKKILKIHNGKIGEETKVIEEKTRTVSKGIAGIRSQFTELNSRLDSLNSFENMDSTLINFGEVGMSRVEQQMMEREELSGLSENHDIQSAFSGELVENGPGAGTSEIQKLNPKQIQQDYFPDLSILKTAQQSLDKSKSKYNELKDSRLEGEGVKRHSLKEESFGERTEISFLGNFSTFKPFVIQGVVGYRIDRQWTAGIGAIWNTKQKTPLPDRAGFKAFGQYWVKESVFIQAEYQNLSGHKDLPHEYKKTQSVFLGGLGTEVQLYKSIRLRSTVLYRVNKLETLKEGNAPQWQATVGIVLKKK